MKLALLSLATVITLTSSFAQNRSQGSDGPGNRQISAPMGNAGALDHRANLPMTAIARGSQINFKINGHEFAEHRERIIADQFNGFFTLNFRPHQVPHSSTAYLAPNGSVGIDPSFEIANRGNFLSPLKCRLMLPISTRTEKDSNDNVVFHFELSEDAYNSPSSHGTGNWDFVGGGSLYCQGLDSTPTIGQVAYTLSFSGMRSNLRLKNLESSFQYNSRLQNPVPLNSLLSN